MNKSDKLDKEDKVSIAKSFSKFFAVDIVIKMFGVTIWEYHFPPKIIGYDS